MKKVDDRSIPERMTDSERILQAMDKAVHDVILEHKLLGRSIVTWKDGKVKIIPPEEIVVNEPTKPRQCSD
jgi:hypothetical protein